MSDLGLNLRPTFALSYDQNKYYASWENISLLFHILLIEILHHTNKLIRQSFQHFLSYLACWFDSSISHHSYLKHLHRRGSFKASKLSSLANPTLGSSQVG